MRSQIFKIPISTGTDLGKTFESDAAENLQTIDGGVVVAPLSQNSYLVRFEPDNEIKAGDRLVDDGVVYHISEVLILNRNRFLQLLCKELLST